MNEINELTDHINAHTKITQDLCDITVSVQDAITKGDIDKLAELVKMQASMLMRYSVHERKVLDILFQVKNGFGIASDQFSIADLSEYVDAEKMGRLNRARDGFRETFNVLADTNIGNRMLLKSRLDVIDYSLRLVESKGYEHKTVMDSFA